MVTYVCVPGGCLWELPSHIHRVQPFHHEDKRSPQLHKPTLRVHLRKQSKSISLVVVGSTYTKYIRAVPQHFPSWLQPPAPAWLGALALRPIPTVGCTNIAQQEQGSFEVGRNRKDVLGHPIPTHVITSDLPANPAWESEGAEMFLGFQTHQVGEEVNRGQDQRTLLFSFKAVAGV